MTGRFWHSELQAWVTDDQLSEALDAAQLAISTYYNGDASEAGRAAVWLLRAYEANQKETAK